MSTTPPLRFRAGTVDPRTGELTRTDGTVESLTPREVELLVYLARKDGEIVSRDELLSRVWGFAPSVVSRAADTAVRRLREKLEVDPAQPDHLLTAFGEGYRLVLTDTARPEAPPEAELLVGRDPVLADLLLRLSEPGPPLALVGPPGAGKTRLGRAVAHRLGHALPGGATWVDVADSRDRAGVAQAVALALGITVAEAGADAERRVGAALAGRGPCLLVLDDGEGVIEPLTSLLRGWRAAAPDARLLVTSREPLRDPDSVAVAVEPLDTAAAVALFEALAQRVRADFVVDDGNRAQVEALVERLERLPLALALAAGRAGAFSPRALLERLDDRFRLLASRDRDVDPRQRSLQAALESSWELLGDAERAALAACSAFRGGFTLDAARAVVGAPATEALLEALRTRSLLSRDGDRFGGFAFVREYATARLAEDPEVERAVHLRHLRYWAARREQVRADDRPVVFSPDRANLLVATERAVALGETAAACETAMSALDVIGHEGPYERGLAICRLVLSLPDLALDFRGILLMRSAALEQWTGGADRAVALTTEALEVAERCDDPASRANALRQRGLMHRARGAFPEARRDLEAALAIAETCGNPDTLCNAITSLGILDREQGRFAEARAHYDRMVAIAREHGLSDQLVHGYGNLALMERRAGRFEAARLAYQASLENAERRRNQRAALIASMGLGNLLLDLGELEQARERYLQAAALARRIGDLDNEGRVEGNLGLVARGLGDLDGARAHVQRAHDTFVRTGDRRNAAIAQGNLGEVLLLLGRHDDAEQQLAAGASELRALGDPVSAGELEGALGEALLALGRPDDAAAALASAERSARAVANPVALAQVLARRGLLELARGEDPTATLREAEALATEVGPRSDAGVLIARLRAALAP